MADKIRFKDLSGWLRFAAIGAIIEAGIMCFITGAIVAGLLFGMFG